MYPLVALAGRVWFARNFAYDCDGSFPYPDAPSSEAYGRLIPLSLPQTASPIVPGGAFQR